eukprot:gene13338-15685_t
MTSPVGSVSPSSSMTNFNILSDVLFQNVNELGAQHHMQMVAGVGPPTYDVELIVQTTKQEDARFMGKKKRRNSSVSKVFLGDFLALSKNVAILKMIARYGDNHILFSDVLIKVNKRNKMQERIVFITERALYNVTPSDHKLKRRISIASLSSLSMSTLEDNVIVVHVQSEYDYVLVSSRKIEIATVLVEAYYKHSLLIPASSPGRDLNNNPAPSTMRSDLSNGGSSRDSSLNGGNTNPLPISSPTLLTTLSTSFQAASSAVLHATTGMASQNNNSQAGSATAPATAQTTAGNTNNTASNNNPTPTPVSSTNTNSSSPSPFYNTLVDHILPVHFTERIEYKTEGDSMREIIFTRVQGAVNIQIQTLRVNKSSNTKRDATRTSIR